MTSPQACPVCRKVFVFSTKVNDSIPQCSCLRDRANAAAQDERYAAYVADAERRVNALNLGPLKDHERQPPQNEWRQGLVLSGNVGVGKTSLLKQVAFAAAMDGYRVRGGYVVELLSRLKDPDQIRPLMAWLTGGTLLILDDIDKVLGTQYEVERLLFIIDRYWANSLPVVVSLNMTLDALERKLAAVRGMRMDHEAEAILSRLTAKGTNILELSGEDRRRA
jgi:DNA replication protein DnaC